MLLSVIVPWLPDGLTIVMLMLTAPPTATELGVNALVICKP